jgi:hypothetical protein
MSKYRIKTSDGYMKTLPHQNVISDNELKIPKKAGNHQNYLNQTVCRLCDTSCARAHASKINHRRAPRLSHSVPSLLKLQREYGNRHVQGVVSLSRQRDETVGVPQKVEQSIYRAQGGGQPLDSKVRVQMESAFHSDFSGVRVHNNAEADRLNRSLGARAFTIGQDIFFRQGEYVPATSKGRKLLVHELIHTVQQGHGQVRSKLVVGQPGDRYEREAESVADKVLHEFAMPTLDVSQDHRHKRRSGEAQPSSIGDHGVSSKYNGKDLGPKFLSPQNISNMISKAPFSVQRQCDIDEHWSAVDRGDDFGELFWQGENGVCTGEGENRSCNSGPQSMATYQAWDPDGPGSYSRASINTRHIVGTVNHPTSENCVIEHESWVKWTTLTEYDVFSGNDYYIVVAFKFRETQRGEGCHETTTEGFEGRCASQGSAGSAPVMDALNAAGSAASIAQIIIGLTVTPGVPPPP